MYPHQAAGVEWFARHPRGLLCGPCNKALAWYESFEPKAKEYLER